MCVDGVCCDSACAGSCQSCKRTGNLGVCGPAPAGSPLSGHPTCGTSPCTGTCNGASTTCTFSSASCGTASCSGQALQAIGACSAGSCVNPAPQPCPGALVCANSTTCKTSCILDSDCQAGHFCSSGGQCNLNAAQVVVGETFTCVLLTDGTVRCWGRGTPTTTTITGFPVRVSSLSAGIDYVCALTTSGGVFCWGTCAFVGPNSGRWCWGSNSSGELGAGTVTQVEEAPLLLGDISNIVGLAGGSAYMCAVQTFGTVWCWGENFSGNLGNIEETIFPMPTPVSLVTNLMADTATSVAAKSNHTCSLLTTGAVKCWGNNTSAQLGTTAVTNSPTPILVPTW